MKLSVISFLLIFQLVLRSSTAQCPQGSILSFTGDVCWYLINVPLNFINAEEYCQDNVNGHLASIHNAFDNVDLTDRAKNLFTQTSRFAVGGNNLENVNNWAWTDGSSFNFNDWANHEPLNSTWKNCLHVDMDRSQWYSAECALRVPFVCQIPVIMPVSTTLPATASMPPKTTTTILPWWWPTAATSNPSSRSPTVPSTTRGSINCPQNGQLSPSGQFCWYPSSDIMDFVNAETTCTNNYGGHLASIRSILDNLKIVDVARESAAAYSNVFYVGGIRLQGNWSWTDGSKFNFNYWATDEPGSETTRSCLAVDISQGLWYAVNCYTEYVYVCQTFSLNYQPTTTANYPTIRPTTTTGSPCSYQNNSCQTVDVVFILDVSQSIDSNYFTQYVKQFVKKIGDAFHMLGDYPLGQTSSRVAVIEFASYANTTLPLITRTREDFNQQIDNYVDCQNEGIKNFTVGLQQALDVFRYADSPSSSTIAILMTDSVTSLAIQRSKAAADALRNEVYFLAGVGIDGINGNQVASDTTNMATLIGSSNLAFGDINAANNPTTGILAEALKNYPCTSSCKFYGSKKEKLAPNLFVS